MIQHQTLDLTDLDPYETYEDCQFTVPSVPAKVTDVTLKRCRFTGALDGTEWLDCTFQDLDLANRSWANGVLYRCTFQACNLLGTNFLGSTWKHTQLVGCRGDYLNLSGARLTACGAQETSLREAALRDVTVTQGFVADRCDLEQASFWGSDLAGVDLATSTFERLEVDADAARLKGLVLNAYQAASVLSLFGVKIK